MNHDPVFWAIACFAILIVGVSKGGFGGIALLSVPLLTLVISPFQAVAILLPVLISMDVISAWSYRNVWDKRVFLLTAPGALIGIGLGTLLAGFVDDKFTLICVGIVSTAFPVYAFSKKIIQASQRTISHLGSLRAFLRALPALLPMQARHHFKPMQFHKVWKSVSSQASRS